MKRNNNFNYYLNLLKTVDFLLINLSIHNAKSTVEKSFESKSTNILSPDSIANSLSNYSLINILRKLIKDFKIQASCILYSVILINRLCIDNYYNINLKSKNFVFLILFLISSKMLSEDNSIMNNSNLSYIICIDVQKINYYESLFLDIINYNTVVSIEEYNFYLKYIFSSKYFDNYFE